MNKTDLDNLSLMDYSVKVRKAARLKDGTALYNGSAAHAEIILTNLWESASENVKVLSQCLSEEVYNSDALIDAAQGFLNRPNTSAVILIEDKPEATNRFYKAMQAHANVTISRVPDSEHGRYDFSMMTVDDESYRFAEDKFEMTAVAAFGDKENGTHLSSVFDLIADFENDSETEQQ